MLHAHIVLRIAYELKKTYLTCHHMWHCT